MELVTPENLKPLELLCTSAFQKFKVSIESYAGSPDLLNKRLDKEFEQFFVDFASEYVDIIGNARFKEIVTKSGLLNGEKKAKKAVAPKEEKKEPAKKRDEKAQDKKVEK